MENYQTIKNYKNFKLCIGISAILTAGAGVVFGPYLDKHSVESEKEQVENTERFKEGLENKSGGND